MAYVIKHETGQYVAEAGSEDRYTPQLRDAAIYLSSAAAMPHRGDNECVVAIEDELAGR